MGWSAAKVYRIEGNRVRVLARDVQRLLTLYGIGGEQRDAVMELARLARVKDWWQQYSGAIPEWFQFYVGLEAAASAMQEYNAELVTGLLQTEPYIRAVMAAAMRADHNDEMERRIKVRTERQKRLTAADAPRLWVVLNEAVLHRQVGGPAVMRDQAPTRRRRRAGQRDGAGPAVHGGRAPGDARLVHPDAVSRPR